MRRVLSDWNWLWKSYSKSGAAPRKTKNTPPVLILQEAPVLKVGRLSGAMPEMQNFNGSPVLVEAVVDVERGNGEAA